MLNLDLESQLPSYFNNNFVINENNVDIIDIYISFDKTYYVHSLNKLSLNIFQLDWYFNPLHVIEYINKYCHFTKYTTRSSILLFTTNFVKQYFILPISVHFKYERYFDIFLPSKSFFDSFGSVVTHWFDVMYHGIPNISLFNNYSKDNNVFDNSKIHIFLIRQPCIEFPFNLIPVDINFIVFYIGKNVDFAFKNSSGYYKQKFTEISVYRGLGQYELVYGDICLISNFAIDNSQINLLKYIGENFIYIENPNFNDLTCNVPKKLKDICSEFCICIKFSDKNTMRKKIIEFICSKILNNKFYDILILDIDYAFVKLVQFLLSEIVFIYVDPNLVYLKIQRFDYVKQCEAHIRHIQKYLDLYSEKNRHCVLPIKRFFQKKPVGREIIWDIVSRMCTLKKGLKNNVYVATYWDTDSKTVYITSNKNVQYSFNQLQYIINGEYEKFCRYKLLQNDKYNSVSNDEVVLINNYWSFLQSNLDKSFKSIILVDNNDHLHAETNLVYYLFKNVKKFPNLITINDYISIAGECCPLCSAFVESCGLRFYARRQNIFSSYGWGVPKDLDSMPECVIKKFIENVVSIQILLPLGLNTTNKFYEERNGDYRDENNRTIVYTMDLFPEGEELLK